MKTAGFVWILCAAACTPSPARTTLASASASATHEPPTPQAKQPIHFIENDYARAVAEARARRLPLFVDAWAPWCHTCLSLRSFVFTDPALLPLAGRFVWASIDTEREENADVVTKLGVHGLPTLYVIDVERDAPILAWPGALTASELASLLEGAVDSPAGRGEAAGAASVALVRGRRAGAEGKTGEAIAAYRAALAAAPPDWPRRGEAVDGLVTQLADDHELEECVDFGAREAPKMPAGTVVADVLRSAIGCAAELPAAAPLQARLAELASLGKRVASDATQPLLADDRSDLYDYVISALKRLGEDDEASRMAREWATFLEQQAARAPTPTARAVFDPHRTLAYIALGHPELALPMLDQSEREFPSDYNPPARLATVYLAMKRPDDALAAVTRALQRAYGPRKLRIFSLQADILEAKGDKAGARKALRAALDYAGTVSLTAGYTKLRDSLEKRLSGIP